MKTRRRLDARSFDVEHRAPLPFGAEAVHRFTITASHDPADPRGCYEELAFSGRGQIGAGIDLLLQDVGIWMSRILQGRHPMTGEELPEDVVRRPKVWRNVYEPCDYVEIGRGQAIGAVSISTEYVVFVRRLKDGYLLAIPERHFTRGDFVEV